MVGGEALVSGLLAWGAVGSGAISAVVAEAAGLDDGAGVAGAEIITGEYSPGGNASLLR